MVICNPRMEIPDASISSVVHSGKLRGGRDSGRIDSSFLVQFFFGAMGKFLGARHLSAFFRALTDLHTTRLFHSTRS
jgi:hypothetical protein